jgi:tetratricopeptide (TPR) repeat protein
MTMIYKKTEYADILKVADEYKLQGLHQEAIKVCESILCDDLECGEAYEEIGDNYLSLREFDKAINALNRALKINPESANAHYLLGFTLSAMNKWDDSIDELEKADSLEPNHPEILRCLGWSIFHSGRRKQGLILLERATAMSKDDSLILCDLGVCYLNERDFDKAEEVFLSVLALEPQNDKARECLKACNYFRKKLKA